MEIKFFCDLKEKILEKIIETHYTYWAAHNPLLKRENVESKFRNELSVSSKSLPLGIALTEKDELIGFCYLRKDNLKSCPNLYPWISGVFIFEKWRHKGYGKMLVGSACDTAKRFNFESIYIWTDQVPEFYKKLGFKFLKIVEKNEGGKASLFVKTLQHFI